MEELFNSGVVVWYYTQVFVFKLVKLTFCSLAFDLGLKVVESVKMKFYRILSYLPCALAILHPSVDERHLGNEIGPTRL